MAKLKAVAYYGGIPARNNNLEKPLILENFIKGVIAVGDEGILHKGMNVIPSDVALIQGFVHEHGKNAPHLQLRKNAFDTQIKQKKKALIVDSNLFLYADPGNTRRYLRYSFNGVFPTTGFYFDKDIVSSRWEKISKHLNIQLQPWRTAGDHILVCLQRNGGWSMRGLDVQNWLDQTIIEIRKYSKKRPIVVRLHPGDKKMPKLIKIKHKNVRLSNNPSDIRKDLKNAWATVLYNSSPAVASAIQGVPVFLTDPNPEYSQAKPVSNTDISKIENPLMPDRQGWIEKLSMCHWNFEELTSGEAWQFFRKYV